MEKRKYTRRKGIRGRQLPKLQVADLEILETMLT